MTTTATTTTTTMPARTGNLDMQDDIRITTHGDSRRGHHWVRRLGAIDLTQQGCYALVPAGLTFERADGNNRVEAGDLWVTYGQSCNSRNQVRSVLLTIEVILKPAGADECAAIVVWEKPASRPALKDLRWLAGWLSQVAAAGREGADEKTVSAMAEAAGRP